MAAPQPIRQKILLGVGLILAVQALNGYWAIHGAVEFMRITAERRAVNSILRTEVQFVLRIEDCETGQRGFLLTGEEPYLKPYQESVDKVPAALAELREACGARHVEKMQRLQTLVDDKLAELAQTIALRRELGGFERALEAVRSNHGKAVMEEIRRIVDEIDKVERANAVRMANELDALSSPTMIRVFLFGLLSVAIAAGAGWFVYRDADKRLAAERRLNEQRSTLDSVINSMDDGVVVVDAAGRFTLFNPAATKIHGVSTPQAPLDEWSRGLGFFKIDKVTPYPIEELPLARALRGEVTNGTELYLKHGDAPGMFLGVSARPIYDEQRQIIGAVAVRRDITLQKENEARLLNQQAELERRVAERTAALAAANAELNQHNRENEMFVYSVSHDLRTPLVNLQGFSNELTLAGKDLTELFDSPTMPPELAGRGRSVLADDVATSVRFIQSAVTRLASIIDSLLRLSRAGRVEYQPTRIDVEALVRRIVDAQQAEIMRRHVVVEILPMPAVWGDVFAIEQMFANLIDNAIKYLATDRPGRITIGVASPAKDEQQRHVLFVRDNGIGIPEQGRQKIFRAFERLHPEQACGEGIGLAVVERIVERHRGRIWVESTLGEGAMFYIALPAPTEEHE